MTPSLSDEINAAIRSAYCSLPRILCSSRRLHLLAFRSKHTTLNRLILRLLPSALPPCTSTPQAYARGIAHFLPVYCAFEIPLRSLHAVVRPPHQSHGIHRLYIPTLERSPSLEQDIKHLLQRPDVNTPESSPLRQNDAVGLELEDGPGRAGRPRLSTFVTHISGAVESKPHVLLAYTWIFYMALFQGGRYIRSQLRGAEEDGFWAQDVNAKTADKAVTGSIPLSFWEFPAVSRDGEELKAEFKARFQHIESRLSQSQKKDVLHEAGEIMTQLLEVIREIDLTSQEENTALSEKSVLPSTILPNHKSQEGDKSSVTEESALLPKLFHLSTSAVTESLIRLRSLISFAPPEPLSIPVKVADSFNEWCGRETAEFYGILDIHLVGIPSSSREQTVCVHSDWFDSNFSGHICLADW